MSNSTGNDSNSCLDFGHPCMTLTHAVTLMRQGYGDWMLLAAGDTFPEGFGKLNGLQGKNAQYPTVITTYVLTDPNNTAKYGLNRAIIDTNGTLNSASDFFYVYASADYLVFQSLYVNVPDSVSFVNYADPIIGGVQNYMLIENCIFKNVGLMVDTPSGRGSHFIVRKSSIAYSWSPSGGGHAQGLIINHWDGITVEDSILYHNGWGRTHTRDADADIFKHNVYQGTGNTNSIFRRNISAWASSHGLQQRPGGDNYDNSYISNPINLVHGGGDNYNVYQPNGVTGSIHDNVVIGSHDINSLTPRGFGMAFANNNPVNVYRNLLIDVGSGSTSNWAPWDSEAQFNQPTIVNRYHNIVYNWHRANDTKDTGGGGAYPAQVTESDANSILDIPAAGSNLDSSSYSWVDTTRTVGTYYQSIGGPQSEQAFLEGAIENPGVPPYDSRSLNAYLRTGFPFPAGW